MCRAHASHVESAAAYVVCMSELKALGEAESDILFIQGFMHG